MVAAMTSHGMRSQHRRMLAATCAAALGAGNSLPAQDDGVRPSDRGGQPRVLWKYAPTDCKFSGVIASQGTVFALDRAGRIHALEAPTGNLLWTSADELRFDYGYGFALSPNPEFDALLVGSDTGFFALDRSSGDRIWHTETPSGVAGPTCTQQVVVAGGADGKVYGCQLATGRILWRHDYLEDRPDDPPGISGEQARFSGRPARPGSAATDGQMVVLPIFDQCRALALDASTGQRLWSFPTRGWMHARATIGPRNVYVSSQDKHVYAIDRTLGKLAWKVQTRARNEGSAALLDRFVYFGSNDSYLYAVDNGVGRVHWKYATEHQEGRGAPIYSRPLVMGDTVYLAAMRGKVYAVNRHTGELIWKFLPLPKSEPNSDLVAANGLLFVTTRKSSDEGESAVIAIAMR